MSNPKAHRQRHQPRALPHKVLIEIDEFFTNYHRLLGKPSRTLGWTKPAAAQRLIAEART